MPERIERYGFIFATIVQIAAVIWWVSALNSSVKTQERITARLDDQVHELTIKTVRIEEKINSSEATARNQLRILEQIQEGLNEKGNF